MWLITFEGSTIWPLFSTVCYWWFTCLHRYGSLLWILYWTILHVCFKIWTFSFTICSWVFTPTALLYTLQHVKGVNSSFCVLYNECRGIYSWHITISKLHKTNYLTDMLTTKMHNKCQRKMKIELDILHHSHPISTKDVCYMPWDMILTAVGWYFLLNTIIWYLIKFVIWYSFSVKTKH